MLDLAKPVYIDTEIDLVEIAAPKPIPKNASLKKKNEVRKFNRRRRHDAFAVMFFPTTIITP